MNTNNITNYLACFDLQEFFENINKKIAIVGAGKYGIYVYKLAKACNIIIESVYDSYKKGNFLNGLLIEDINEISDKDDLLYIVAVSRVMDKINIRTILEDKGINNILDPIPCYGEDFYSDELFLSPEYRNKVIGSLWKKKRRYGNRIERYLESNHLFRLCVYEIEDFSGWLDMDLTGTNITIIRKINERSIIPDIDVDAFIVLDEVNYDRIENEIMKISSAQVIGIQEILGMKEL